MSDKAVIVTIIVVGVLLIVAFVLTRLQGICLDVWAMEGGETPPCWLPFGA